MDNEARDCCDHGSDPPPELPSLAPGALAGQVSRSPSCLQEWSAALREGALALIGDAVADGLVLHPWDGNEGMYVLLSTGQQMGVGRWSHLPVTSPIEQYTAQGRFDCVHDDFASRGRVADENGRALLTLSSDLSGTYSYKKLLGDGFGGLGIVYADAADRYTVLRHGSWAPGVRSAAHRHLLTSLIRRTGGAPDLPSLAAWAAATTVASH